MVKVIYDGTFEGWLSCVFDIYEYKLSNVDITSKNNNQINVFNTNHESFYDELKAARVWKGLGSKISKSALTQLYHAFLSEEKGIENVLLNYAQYAFASKFSIENDFTNSSILKVVQTAKKVYREKHRMEAFVRFQLTKDELFYAICEPDFNVLPLIAKHFKNRYTDQKWLIYDSKRKYGLYYDLCNVETVELTFTNLSDSKQNIELICDEKEALYQHLWQQYFKSVNIAARKNTKLHIQHMPKRYWKYLPEKQL